MMVKQIKQVNLIVHAGVGGGGAADAAAYVDQGSNTLGNTTRAVGDPNLPHLAGLRLGSFTDSPGVPPVEKARGAYGHRNNPQSCAEALEVFEPDIEAAMPDTDVTIITADHGNDPTIPSTDPFRERVPVLSFGQMVKPNFNIGPRSSFADLAATIANLLDVLWSGPDTSFAGEVIKA